MTTEREHVESVRDGIAKWKELMRAADDAAQDIMRNLRGIMAHNKDDAAKSNAAYTTLGEFEALRGKAIALAGEGKVAHGNGSERLMTHWPEYEGIVAMGPGR